MLVVAGLGNPGPQYRRTRHNAGFLTIDVLAARAEAVRPSLLRDPAGEALAWVAEVTLEDRPVLLAKPLAYMNRSGVPVARLLSVAEASPADLVVVVDDVALELGTIRVRERGSHGGHNGLRSISAELGTDEYGRVRIGVARRELPGDLAEFVLSEVAPEEAPLFHEGVRLAADAVACVLAEGTSAAMNRFNARRA